MLYPNYCVYFVAENGGKLHTITRGIPRRGIFGCGVSPGPDIVGSC